MIKAVSRTIFKLQGWTFKGADLVTHRRCVVIAAPHTSNWDLLYTLASFDLMGLPVRFTVKKMWMDFPLSIFTKPAGGISIDRSPRAPGEERQSMVNAMIGLFDNTPGDLAIAVTPEGTRSLRTKWRTGFYYVALGANVPILLGYLDFEKREAGIGKVVHPSGDIEADMRVITEFYANITPKFPELFSLDERYVPGSAPVETLLETPAASKKGRSAAE